MKYPIKVMHILHTLGTAGLQKGVVNIANQLNSNGFEISICCLEQSGVFEERLNSGAKVFVMNKQPGIDYVLPMRLARLFRSEGTMIVHTHNFATYLYGALGAGFALSPKVIHGEHGSLLQPPDGQPRHLVIRRYLSCITAAFHTVSADMRNALIRMTGIEPSKIVTILNGIDLAKFRKTPGSITRMLLGIQPEELVIGTVGRLAQVKNYELLIQAISEASHAGVHPRLLFVGDGPSRSRLESLTEQHHLEKQVLFLGDRSDVPELLNIMDIFVLPSFSEGLSNSIMEAMAVGIPVIASDVGGNPELVSHGETGFLFPSCDATALTQQILELVEDSEKRHKMGALGQKRMEELFTLDKMIQNYARLYRSVLGSSRYDRGAYGSLFNL